MTISHDMLVFLAKTLGLFWMLGFFLVAATLAYLPSRRAVYDRAARSILPAEVRDEGSRGHEP